MNRETAKLLTVLGAAAFGASGWVANDFVSARACSYTANGYERLDVDLSALPEYPLERVENDVVGEIQKCWAAHPYHGPRHVLQLVDARKAADGGHYLLFEPQGITDTQLAFFIDPKRGVKGAYVRSMF